MARWSHRGQVAEWRSDRKPHVATSPPGHFATRWVTHRRCHAFARVHIVQVLGVAAFLLTPSLAYSLTEDAQARFFRDCPHRQPNSLHDDANPWDLHALLYTAAGVMEVEVLRLADWAIDLPLPGKPVRPLNRLTEAWRAGYRRLPPWKVTQRLGEFTDAWQLPEISLGDVSAVHSVTTGGLSGPGSGMVARLQKLVDWGQHVTGDVNRLLGRPIGRRQGLVRWSLPERIVDGAQGMLMHTFTQVSVLVTHTLDGGLTALEMSAEGVLNVGRRRQHQDTTVFLQVTSSLYHAHEVWFLEQQAALWMGRLEALRRSTHAALMHSRAQSGRREPLVWPRGERTLVVMTNVSVMATAPEGVREAVVPAAWVFEDSHDGEDIDKLPGTF